MTAALGCGLLLLVALIRPPSADPRVAVRDIENRFWTQKAFAEPKYSLIALGDSRTYRGISTDVLDQELPNTSALNFGFSSAGLSSALLQEGASKLSPTAQRPIIVLAITPWSLTNKAAENSHIEQELARPLSERLERLYLSPLLSSLNPFTPKLLKELLQGGEKPPKVLYHQIHHDHGWVESWKVPKNSEEQLKPYAALFDNNGVSTPIVDQLMMQIKRWTQSGITVVAFRPPSTLAMEALENAKSGFSEAAIQREVENSGGIWLTFGSSQFTSYDGSHLERESAKRFSQALGHKLRSLAAPIPRIQ